MDENKVDWTKRKRIMRTFDYEKLAELHWDNEELRHVAKIHEYKGRLTAFADRNPKEALRLAAQKLPITTKFIVRRDYDTQNQNA